MKKTMPRDLHVLRSRRGVWLLVVLLLVALFVCAWFAGGRMMHWLAGGKIAVRGIVWQIDHETAHTGGNWEKLGADSLLVQWTQVDDICFAACPGKANTPDWLAVARQPWARHVLLGLAGKFNETTARADVVALAKTSAEIARRPLPVNIAGYYFPVEVDPSWEAAPQLMVEALAELPRPIWISVYDGYNIGGKAVADWLAAWLPDDVGILFQDGVGVEVRSPAVARDYMDALAAKFGHDRVKVIVEAFRPLAPLPSGAAQFRAATAEELYPQIVAMQGYDIYLFDGPHYVKPDTVDALLRLGVAKGAR